MLRVLHLTGSPVSPFFAELSTVYGRGCLGAAADPARYEFLVAHVTPDGRWRFPADLTPRALAAARPVGLPEALGVVESLSVDVAVPQLFCLPGMTTFRALLDALGVPYPGNPPDVMALGADKAMTRAVVAAAGVPVPEGRVVTGADPCPLPPPFVVKPVDADNSDGLALVRDRADYRAALDAAFACSPRRRALVERYVPPGREVRCGVLVRSGVPTPLPLEEYPLPSGVRPRADKLADDGDGSLSLVAKADGRSWIVDHDDPVTAAVQEQALRCHEALGCRDYSLFDFRVDPEGRPWFLEAGLYCSFAPTSVITTMAAAAGIGLAELFAEAVTTAARRG
ncbi:D-alanine--D-alanine ligase family protein [Actinosynnema pretiosum]|uniref:D-alanine--D-alanine ligase n=1 Tax=Actinosynnema pretiosum TaxID=42197 RepID=A0A290Z8Z1_9PSEU|nr:D-alanine--D-alanine ligase [Actinosynnema pretiosum]ATE55511.1 D-alanine--D-alanine ligase [Actinosynnema pretiosum]